MKIQVSEFIVRYLERLGIDTIFGMPGAHILPVYDDLYRSGIESILAKHEQGAAFMAGGYARASGRIGACIATAGPGATNLVTGIANAYVDKLPVIAITGEAPTPVFGKGGLQESSGEGGSIDQGSLFRGITRYHRLIERTDYLVNVLNQAARILLSPTPGPVLLSIPYNVQKERIDEQALERVGTSRSATPRCPEAFSQATALGELLTAARQPVIVAGHGCVRSGAREQVAALSDSLNIPVATTLKGKGAIGESSELSLGSLGVTSSGIAYRYIVEQSDLILFLGAGFNERTSYLWDRGLLENKRLVQIDNDPAQLEKVFQADLAIEGDIRTILQALLAQMPALGLKAGSRKQVGSRIERAKHQVREDYTRFRGGFSLVESLFRRLSARFADDLTLFDDNIIFAQNFLEVAGGTRYYPNTGISSLGHAIPAAIGARFAGAGPTFAILGDGGFQMCCMEIMTAVNYRKPLNIVLFNNGTMGLIRKNQYQQYQGRFISCDFINPDYAQLASAFGIRYRRVEREEDLDALFEHHDLTGEMNLIDLHIDKDNFPNYSSGR